MKKILFFLPAFLFVSLALTSCRKDDDTNNNVSSTAQAIAEDIVSHNDLGEQSELELDELIPDNLTNDGADDRNNCATITYAQPKGTWPNTITIDYGTGCTKASVTFKGKIIAQQTNKMTVAGAVRTITYENFFVEDVQVGGTKTVTNTGLNAAGQPTFTRTGNETLTFPDGSTATRSINHTRTMTQGFGTPARADDVWTININDSGTNRKGNPYTVTSTTPLSRKVVCPWMSAGVLTFINEGKTRTLDFGDGTCNRDAVLTLADGSVKEVKIRHRWWK
jgi:hypothetical protein